jgi:hypothetical protein
VTLVREPIIPPLVGEVSCGQLPTSIFSCQFSTSSRARVTLRLTVSQSVCLGFRAHFVDVWQDIVPLSRVWVWNLLSCLCGAPCLTRGRICLL